MFASKKKDPVISLPPSPELPTWSQIISDLEAAGVSTSTDSDPAFTLAEASQQLGVSDETVAVDSATLPDSRDTGSSGTFNDSAVSAETSPQTAVNNRQQEQEETVRMICSYLRTNNALLHVRDSKLQGSIDHVKQVKAELHNAIDALKDKLGELRS